MYFQVWLTYLSLSLFGIDKIVMHTKVILTKDSYPRKKICLTLCELANYLLCKTLELGYPAQSVGKEPICSSDHCVLNEKIRNVCDNVGWRMEEL